jgi:hypothetical protein
MGASDKNHPKESGLSSGQRLHLAYRIQVSRFYLFERKFQNEMNGFQRLYRQVTR